MAKLLQTLIPLLFLLTLFLAKKVHSQGTIFGFDSLLSEPNQLTYQGDANVPSGSKFLRLTKTDASGNPMAWSTGRALYSSPVQFWNESGGQATFLTTIRFRITKVDDNPADGIAFFIAPVNSTIPRDSGGGNLGIFDPSGTPSSLFAVEFDIFVNTGWDPSYRHIGIDIQSRTSTKDTRCDNLVGQEVVAHIIYEATTKTIRVIATAGSQFFTVSDVFDLKRILPQQVQVGISAATGGSVANFDVLAWHFTSILV